MVGGRAVRCILFDLGRTLWTRREELASLAERQAYAKAGGILMCAIGNPVLSAMDDVALGAHLRQKIGVQMRAEYLQYPGYEPDCVLATMRALQQLGIEAVNRGLAGAIFEALRVRIPVSRVLFDDTLSTLAALKQRGYRLGVVTNRSYGGPLFREDVAAMGLLDYFEYASMAISADLGVCKPHPDIFKYALNGLNVSPEETVMVGDKLETDIAGAKGLNMLAIWKPAVALSAEERHAPGKIEPDMEIEQLNQLLELF